MADSQRLQETIGKDCKALCKCRVFTNGGREGALIRGVGLHKCPSSCPLPRVGQGQRLPPHLLQPRVSRGGSPPGCSQGQLPRGGNMGGGLEGCLKWTRQGRVLGRGIDPVPSSIKGGSCHPRDQAGGGITESIWRNARRCSQAVAGTVTSASFLGEPASCFKEETHTSQPKDSPRGALRPCQPSAPEEDAWKGSELMSRVRGPLGHSVLPMLPWAQGRAGSPGQQRGLWVGFDH